MGSLILGPGSLGLLFAAQLSRTGPVNLLGHPGTPVTEFQGEICHTDATCQTIRLPLQGSDAPLPDNPTLLLVTTKATATLEALADLLPRLSRTLPVVLLQNGMGSQQAVAARFPEHAIMAATTTEGANRPRPDQVVHAGQGETWLGALTATAEDQLDSTAGRLRQAGFRTEISNDINARLWHKLAVNAGINPFTALLQVKNGDLPGQPFFREQVDALCREIAAVAKADGVPMTAVDLARRIHDVCAATADNISSMLQDTQAGRNTEIDFINGYIIRRGEALGIDTPVNRELTERVSLL